MESVIYAIQTLLAECDAHNIEPKLIVMSCEDKNALCHECGTYLYYPDKSCGLKYRGIPIDAVEVCDMPTIMDKAAACDYWDKRLSYRGRKLKQP
jgi:hypothetical protein